MPRCVNCRAEPALSPEVIRAHDDDRDCEIDLPLCHGGRSPTCYEQWRADMVTDEG